MYVCVCVCLNQYTVHRVTLCEATYSCIEGPPRRQVVNTRKSSLLSASIDHRTAATSPTSTEALGHRARACVCLCVRMCLRKRDKDRLYCMPDRHVSRKYRNTYSAVLAVFRC